jgi:hypothetical protein
MRVLYLLDIERSASSSVSTSLATTDFGLLFPFLPFGSAAFFFVEFLAVVFLAAAPDFLVRGSCASCLSISSFLMGPDDLGVGSITPSSLLLLSALAVFAVFFLGLATPPEKLIKNKSSIQVPA